MPEESSGEYERCVLNIRADFLGDAVLSEVLQNKELITLTPDNRIVQNFIHLKNSMTRTSKKDFEYVLGAVATDIVFLIKQSKTFVQNEALRIFNPISLKIMDYINEHYSSNITLRDIAEHFFLSVSSVSHIFKDNFGVSIKKYIIEKRMNEIRICLQNGEKPQAVSNDFGFSNYSTFYRSYCKHFGIPPSHTPKK